ncbi:MAG: DUF418 domain-containing protein [Bacteroidales bacterium]
MSTITSPVTSTERIVLLDVLRGLAIFGILMVNMQIFYRPVSLMLAGYPGFISIADTIAEILIKFFFEGKFYVIFSMLFGYGFWLFINKPGHEGKSIIPVFRRRAFFLLIFGILHVVLLWAGDILVFYALFGFLLIAFRRKSGRSLIKWAIWLILIPIIISSLGVLMTVLASMDPEAKTAVDASLQERATFMESMIVKASAVYSTGSFTEIVSIRLREYQLLLPGILFFYPMVFAMFLTGVWAAKKEIIRNYQDHLPFFRKTFRIALITGLIANTIYTYSYFQTSAAMADIYSVLYSAGHIIGGISFGIAYISGIVLLVNRGKLKGFGSLMSPVGRMALTNYLMHSIICTTLFLSYGFGLFSQITAWQGVLLTIVIFGIQIYYSKVWLKYFDYGPFEWLWRSLTYGRLMKFRKSR